MKQIKKAGFFLLFIIVSSQIMIYKSFPLQENIYIIENIYIDQSDQNNLLVDSNDFDDRDLIIRGTDEIKLFAVEYNTIIKDFDILLQYNCPVWQPPNRELI